MTTVRRRPTAAPRLHLEDLEARTVPATLSNFLTTEHVDLNVTLNGTTFGLQVRDDDNGVAHSADDALLYTGINAAQSRPAGAQFDFIGVAAGETYYRLPQTQNTDLIYVGFAASGVAVSSVNRYDPSTESGGRVSGTSGWVRLTLESVTGPGQFSIWQSGDTAPTVFMSTTDGVSTADSVWVPAGGHQHFNFGFTAPGRYEVRLRPSANLNTDGNVNTLESVVTGDPVTLYFSVINVGRFEFAAANTDVSESVGNATITVNRVGGSDGRITVNYATSNGSATSGQDYTSSSGTLTFNDGETSKTFTVPITDDQIEEGNETINLTLSAPGPASIADHAVGLPGGSLLGTLTTATITILANDTNTDPTISDIPNTTIDEDTPVTVDFTIGDSPTPPEQLTVTATSNNISLVPNTATALFLGGSGANRTLTITPSANAFGSATITVTVTDPSNRSVSDTFVLTVNPVADTPTITASTTLEDTQTTTGLVLTRNPADGVEVTHFKITAVRGGTLFHSNGTTPISPNSFITVAEGAAGLKFTPAPDANSVAGGPFGFDARASLSANDIGLGGNTATGTVTVTPVNDEPTGSVNGDVTVSEDSGQFTQLNFLTGIGPGGGQDEVSQTVSITASNTNNGLFSAQPTISGAGTLTFTPAENAFGSATVTVTITDTGGTSNGGDNTRTETFLITVTPVNDDPTANPDTVTVTEDSGPTTIGVLDNDTDAPDTGETLTITGVTQPANGSVTFTALGVTYTPNPNFFGEDEFTYDISDGNGGTATGLVTVTVTPVNDFLPVANDDEYGVIPGNILRGNVLLNDTDDDGDVLTATLAADVTAGALTLNPDGSFTYVPGPGFTGTDSFTYIAADGLGGTDTATVTISARPADPGIPIVYSEDHLDVGIGYDAAEDEWEPHIHDEDNGIELEADEAIIHVRPEANTPRPAGAAFDFIGVPAGEPIWRLPEVENPQVLYLGLGAEEVDSGVFENDAVTLEVLAVDGPGQFAAWLNSDTGPVVLASTADGIGPNDSLPTTAGSHGHLNWAFTAPGVYHITVRAAGTLVGGTRTTSDPVTYVFVVDPPNGAPVQTAPTAVTTQPGVPVLFAGANSVSVADADPHTAPFTITLNAMNGTVSVNASAAVTFIIGDGTADSEIEMQGSLEALNDALAGLVFTPAPGFTGNATLTITTTDPGLIVGSENARSDTDTITITVAGPVTPPQPPQPQPIAVGSGSGGTARMLDGDGNVRFSVMPFTPTFTGGIRVATSDVTGDGVPDLITATGPGGAPHIKVFDGQTGAEVASFLAFEPTFTGGVFVAAGDLDGDGRAEVVATPDEGGGPRVVVFTIVGRTGVVRASFLGIEDPNFRGGARVAVGDVNGDNVLDLVVSAGFGGGPRIAIFDGLTIGPGQIPERLVGDFFVFEETLRNGTYVAVGDVDGDGLDDLMFGAGPGGAPRVIGLDARGLLAGQPVTFADLFVGNTANRSGVRVAAVDVDGDGDVELVAGAADGSTRVSLYQFDGGTTQTSEYDPLAELGGVFVG